MTSPSASSRSSPAAGDVAEVSNATDRLDEEFSAAPGPACLAVAGDRRAAGEEGPRS